MDPDLLLVAGIVLAVFSIPSIFSAYSEGQLPRVSVIVLIASGGLIAWAITQMPDGFAIADIPKAFVRVAARYMP